MMLEEIMNQRNFTKYRLSKISNVPYTTISDICSGKAQFQKCSAETVYKIASALGVSMESLLTPYLSERCSFELFKSNICHKVKTMGDTEFIIETLERDDIRRYFNLQWYAESLYLLAMLDYISKENHVPLCSRYNDLRKCRLKQTLYPAGILAMASVADDTSIKEKALSESIPEFTRFNIVESEVRNVI
jgi:transcriptional regulator with XRE-family HTH domain